MGFDGADQTPKPVGQFSPVFEAVTITISRADLLAMCVRVPYGVGMGWGGLLSRHKQITTYLGRFHLSPLILRLFRRITDVHNSIEGISYMRAANTKFSVHI